MTGSNQQGEKNPAAGTAYQIKFHEFPAAPHFLQHRPKKVQYQHIKKYLRTHNLIKAGSSAPENILRKLFEDSYLAGDIYNKNPDNLLHNYLNDETFN